MISFPLRLVDLDPEWITVGSTPHSVRRSRDLTLESSQGILFLDPIEFIRNQGAVGTSSVLCWFKARGVSDDESPGPGRWDVAGTGFHDLTLSPSIDLTMGGEYPGRWHGWIKNGEVT